MHPENEMTVNDFLLEARKIPEPVERLRTLESSEFSEQPAVRAARAWWAARYSFEDRRKTRTMDRYLWFLLTLKSWASQNPTMRGKLVVSAYQEAFLSPETEQAMALEDRFEQEVLDACVLYVGTIDPSPGFFGIRVGKSLKPDEVLRRIAAIVSKELLAGLYRSCAQLRHADLLARCLWKSAEEVYPGIAAHLEEKVRGYDEQMREFVLRAVGQSQA